MTARRRPGGTFTEPGRARHIPVLLSEVVASLRPVDGATYIDGTFGAGGYTRAILEAADCSVLALDRDPGAILGAKALKEEFGDRLTLLESRFSELDLVAREQGVAPVDGVVLDIGVSSMQLDEAERGFSFQADGPLDMRMSSSGPSAADVVNETDEEDLARILYVLGEERRSRAIARLIVKARAEDGRSPPRRALAELVSRAVGGRRGDDRASGDADVPGAAHLRERRAGRAGPRPCRRRALPEAGRPAGGRHLPLARGPHREALFATSAPARNRAARGTCRSNR